MDHSSQTFEEADEECQSSESGWTMYIVSPSNGDGELEFDEEDSKDANNHVDEDGDTDDSMASDASSGPIGHKEQLSRNGKSGVHNKNSKEKGKESKDKSCSLTKKANNSKKFNGYKNEDKEESVFSSKGTKVLSNGNVRKSIWMGKGK